jgi:hypothetical protein
MVALSGVLVWTYVDLPAHWKCGAGQPVAGSSPVPSASVSRCAISRNVARGRQFGRPVSAAPRAFRCNSVQKLTLGGELDGTLAGTFFEQLGTTVGTSDRPANPHAKPLSRSDSPIVARPFKASRSSRALRSSRAQTPFPFPCDPCPYSKCGPYRRGLERPRYNPSSLRDEIQSPWRMPWSEPIVLSGRNSKLPAYLQENRVVH